MDSTSGRDETSGNKALIEQITRLFQASQEETENMLAAQPENMLSEMLILIRPRLVLLQHTYEQKVQARIQNETTATDYTRRPAESPSPEETPQLQAHLFLTTRPY